MQQPLYIYDLRYVQHKDFDAKTCSPQCPVSWWLRDMHLAKCNIYIYIYIYIFVHCGCIPSPISHVHILLLWYTLSSLFAALTHSLIVYCPHSSPHLLTQCVLSSLFSALTQCLLPSLFTVLTQLACPVSNIHSLRCLSVYCPNSSLHCLT